MLHINSIIYLYKRNMQPSTPQPHPQPPKEKSERPHGKNKGYSIGACTHANINPFYEICDSIPRTPPARSPENGGHGACMGV